MSTNNTSLGELMTEARELHGKGDLAEAEKRYRRIIESSPGNPQVLALLGTLNAQRGNFQEAIRLLEQSLAIEPRQPFALNSLGNALNSVGRYEEALAAFDKLVAFRLNNPTPFNNRATSLRALRRPHEALASIDKAIMANPEYAEAFNNRGLALHDLGRREDALRSYDRAIALKPEFPDALKNRGNVLRALKRFEDASKSYDKAIGLMADAGAYHGRSVSNMALNRFDDAVRDIEKAVELDPRLPYALGQLMAIKTQLCHWEGLEQTRKALVSAIENGALACAPFASLSLPCAPSVRRRCAELHVADRYPSRVLPPSKVKRRVEASPRDRIRLAYLSGNFESHALVLLIAGVFEHHDKERFDVHGVSFGPTDQGAIRSRLEGAFDHFVDVGGKSDLEVAELLRDRQIDIAVDLMGFAAGCRTGILSFRPAPVQVNYLGFPGTMGADYIDYVIADRVVIPVEDHAHYSERVVYLPDTYQCNDSKRPMASAPPRRAEVGLPDDGFVFCSFNGDYKITPEMFDVWMRILKRCEGSVLWLLESNAAARRNLQKEAEKRGISGDRLVFAPVVAYPAHLARHRLADLFLDTLPIGAHTTASDALWAGLPVLTCLGDSFAGRVGASLLDAVGLPELVTRSPAEYEEMAVALAGQSSKLAQIKAQLDRNRTTHALFDTARFTRNLEDAYSHMVERHRSGQPPTAFAVGSPRVP